MAYRPWILSETGAPDDGRGPPFITEKPDIYANVRKSSDPRAAVISEAARRVAAEYPRLHVETIAQERGFLSGLMFEKLADMVLEGRPRQR